MFTQKDITALLNTLDLSKDDLQSSKNSDKSFWFVLKWFKNINNRICSLNWEMFTSKTTGKKNIRLFYNFMNTLEDGKRIYEKMKEVSSIEEFIKEKATLQKEVQISKAIELDF